MKDIMDKARGEHLLMIAGIYAVDSREAMQNAGQVAKENRVDMIYGGAFLNDAKNRGLGEKALGYMKQVAEDTGLPLVSNILDTGHVSQYKDAGVRGFLIGPESVSNYHFVDSVARQTRVDMMIITPTLDGNVEQLKNAVHTAQDAGQENIIICMRGVRTQARYAVDYWDINAFKNATNKPVIYSPGCVVTNAKSDVSIDLIADAAVKNGADGLMFALTDNHGALNDIVERTARKYQLN